MIDIRLQSHQLTTPRFAEPRELVAWMGAMQAQNYSMAKWAIGVRLSTPSLERVERALAQGEIIRTHIMRPTWHFVAAEDLRWMLKLTGPRVKAAGESWCKQFGIKEEEYRKCNRQFEKMLIGNRHLTREEMGEELERAKCLVHKERLKYYIFRAEAEGILCSGADKGKSNTYALLEERVRPVPDISREEALTKLARNYFRSHSPASLQDFIWWSGLLISEAKQAIALLQGELRKEFTDAKEVYVHDSCEGKPVTDPVLHLLPSYDEYLISYKERSSVLDPAHYSKAFNNWGIFYPVILYNGRIIGNWKNTGQKNRLKVETSFFEQHDTRGLVDEAIDRLKRFYFES